MSEREQDHAQGQSEINANIDINPELGDFITIHSDKYNVTTGRVVYRDAELLRIKPVKSDAVVDFPIGEDGLFDPSTGVTALFLKEKRTDPHYSKQLNAIVGDSIELFDPAGVSLGIVGYVRDIIATDDMDAIQLDNDKYLNFRFIGPKPAIGYIVAHSTEAEEPIYTEEPIPMEEPVMEGVEIVPTPDFEFDPDTVQYVESEADQYTYSDSVQRQDMFVSFMDDEPVKRQKDPKVIQSLFRLTDIFLALKNSIVVRDGTGAIDTHAEQRSYIVHNVNDALNKQPAGHAISGILPVANVKKILYMDEINEEDREFTDVSVKNDLVSLYNMFHAEQRFANSKSKESGFVPYIYSMFNSTGVYEAKETATIAIEIDQDLLRSQIPDRDVEGIPIVPPFEQKGEIQLLKPDSIGRISNRYVRLLGPSRTKLIQKTQQKTTEISYAVAQADTADTVAHILLSSNLLPLRQPIRSSVLLWDILASDRSRKSSQIFYEALMKNWANQIVIAPTDEPLSLLDILEDRLQPNVAPVNPNSTMILDSFGLKNLEISEDLYGALTYSTERGIEQWNTSFAQLLQSAKAELDGVNVPVFTNIVDLDSPLFPMTNAIFQEVFNNFVNTHSFSALKANDLALTNDLLPSASYTFVPFWHSIISDQPIESFPHVENDYRLELERIKQNTLRKQYIDSQFVATPDLNPCKHVNKYEQIMRVKEDSLRMGLLNKFLKTYSAGKKGDTIMCNVCKRDLVCMHEVLLLNEYQHIGKKDVLHKALLLEFAGPAFEGSYICKVCGQKIRDIDYDTSLEFDDEGRPLVGRSIIEDEKDEFDFQLKDETEEKKADFPFKDDIVNYTNIHTCFEACGMEVEEVVYARTIDAVKIFHEYLPTEAKYEKNRKPAFEKLKSEAKRKDFNRQFPPFKQYYANAMIGCIGALAILELQTTSASVKDPVVGCAFSTGGAPLEQTGTGAFDYVTCALALRKPSGLLWNDASWSLETNRKSLTEEISGSIQFALDVILQKKKATTLASLTEIYTKRLAEARRASEEDLPSYSDKLPASFRPLQQFQEPSVMEEEPLGNIASFQRSVESENFEKVVPTVVKRQRQLNDAILLSMHNQAKQDVVPNTNNPRSDATGGFTRIALASLRGFGYQSLSVEKAKMEEIKLLNQSFQSLKRKDHAYSANGTHVYVPWSSPHKHIPEPEIDISILYKLFLKHCFRGTYEGYIHEIGPDFVCRRCQFAYPAELQYLTSSEIAETNSKKLEVAIANLMKQREDVILAKFQEQGVIITKDTFLALDEKVRFRKQLRSVELTKPNDLLSVFESIKNRLDPSMQLDWVSFVVSLRTLKGTTDDTDRRITLSDFSTKYDTLFESIQKVWYDNQIAGREKPDFAKSAVEQAKQGFIGSTSDPYVATRNLIHMFVVGAEQIAQSSLNTNPDVRKWFPNVNRNHAIELSTVWDNHASVPLKTIRYLDGSDDATKMLVKACLHDFAQKAGNWLKVWLLEVKPDPDCPNVEFIFALRWCMLAMLHEMLRDITPFVQSIEDLDTIDSIYFKNAHVIVNRWVIDSLKSMNETIRKYQLNDAQIQEAITSREEKERDFFIKKIDVLEGEMRQIELMKKKIGLGDWNVSSKNLFTYNRDWWEHELEQRSAMGIVPGFAENVDGSLGQGQGQGQEALPVVNPYSDQNDHRVQEHEDE